MNDIITSAFKHQSKSDWYLKTDIRKELNIIHKINDRISYFVKLER